MFSHLSLTPLPCLPCSHRLGSLKCTAGMTSLLQCMTKPWGSLCAHKQDVGVRCSK